jgi:hypothetical protein
MKYHDNIERFRKNFLNGIHTVSRIDAPKLLNEVEIQSPEGFRGTFVIEHEESDQFHIIRLNTNYPNPIAIFVKEFGRPAQEGRAIPMRVSDAKKQELLAYDDSGSEGYRLSPSGRRKLIEENIVFRTRVGPVQPSWYISNITNIWINDFIDSLISMIQVEVSDLRGEE